MCSKPKKPKAPPPPPPPPPPPQEAKAPDSIDPKRRNRSAGRSGFSSVGGTLLTGPAGVGGTTTGKTMLGG
jgi:hypothetical protein